MNIMAPYLLTFTFSLPRAAPYSYMKVGDEQVAVVDTAGAPHRPPYWDKAPNPSFCECCLLMAHSSSSEKGSGPKEPLYQEVPWELCHLLTRGSNCQCLIDLELWKVGRLPQGLTILQLCLFSRSPYGLWMNPRFCQASFPILLPLPSYKLYMRALSQ